MKPLSKWLLRVAFFLLVTGQVLLSEASEPVVPPYAKEYLRHDQHGLLVFGSLIQGNRWLITRQQTYKKEIPLGIAERQNIQILNRHCLGGPSLPVSQLIKRFQAAYVQLLSPFQPQLTELQQLTIVPGSELKSFPFEALVPPDIGDNSPLFLGEFYTIGYLMDFNFQREQAEDLPLQLLFDSTGVFWDVTPPQAHAHLIQRSHSSLFFPHGVKQHCLDLIHAGASTPDALAEARTAYFKKVRVNPTAIDSTLLDPRHWAQAMVYGSVDPVFPARDFPWWILVPIGLVLVILFGKRF